MQKRVVLVSAAAVLGLAAVVLGVVASKKSKGFVSFESFDEQHCVYRRKPALGCGVAAALLALTGVALATAAGECLGPDAPATGRRRAVAVKYCKNAWAAVAMAVVMFLYGVAMKRGLSATSGIFFTASNLSAVATGYAIAAYVNFQRTDEPAPGQFVELGVAMGQPQWAQPYPPPPYPPPMANPAPPQYGHGGYGPRQSAGTA
ncbi:uncharacterized protein [Miscanthus floridulus]|uniref:uncharacterized protein n=1 Tax=Miscanthus floridulus TaxID=154761 RepID=UPI0034596CE4